MDSPGSSGGSCGVADCWSPPLHGRPTETRAVASGDSGHPSSWMSDDAQRLKLRNVWVAVHIDIPDRLLPSELAMETPLQGAICFIKTTQEGPDHGHQSRLPITATGPCPWTRPDNGLVERPYAAGRRIGARAQRLSRICRSSQLAWRALVVLRSPLRAGRSQEGGSGSLWSGCCGLDSVVCRDGTCCVTGLFAQHNPKAPFRSSSFVVQ